VASFADLHLDNGIARALHRGDRHAQGVAYRLLAPTILGMAVRILQDHGLAQEVLQDTFVDLMEKAGTLRDPDAVIGWVRRVAINHCYMRLRSPWHRRREAVDGVPEVEDPAVDCERWQSQCDLDRALARLPPETRLVIWLHDVEGYTHQEIGRLTGQTVSYSKSQLARGYGKLTRMLHGDVNEIEADAVRPAGHS
jgi:RNA polymerase sigma factor (sigma-70 family)